MAGVAQRNKVPGPASLFWTRKTSFQQIGVGKMFMPPNLLRSDCRALGLEANQGHIKLLHFPGFEEKKPE